VSLDACVTSVLTEVSGSHGATGPRTNGSRGGSGLGSRRWGELKKQQRSRNLRVRSQEVEVLVSFWVPDVRSLSALKAAVWSVWRYRRGIRQSVSPGKVIPIGTSRHDLRGPGQAGRGGGRPGARVLDPAESSIRG